VLAEQQRKILDFVVKQYGRGNLNEREIVCELRQVLRETSLSELLHYLPDVVAKLLVDSLKILGRFHCTYPPFPDDCWRMLAYADSLLVLSLLPEQQAGPEQPKQFHGYPVLGEIEVRSSELYGQLMEALRRGIYGDSMVKRCWDPHHGLRAVCGVRCLDLVICFRCECMQVFADSGSDEYTWADIGKAPEQVMNRLLSVPGVRLTEEQG
jgi:hypothetical protein